MVQIVTAPTNIVTASTDRVTHICERQDCTALVTDMAHCRDG
jgi:hypothetical protein